MANGEGKLSDGDEHKLLELYKELGSDVRHFDRHIYIVNFQMLPALVIGLLVLYGRIKKFAGIEFEQSESVYVIVWIGCLLISLMWIIAVSRFAQVFHIHAKTRQDCECLLGLNGHRKIDQMDDQSKLLKLPHYKIRLIGFLLYFWLLLLRCPFFHYPILDFTDCSVHNHYLLVLSIILSSVVTGLVWLGHFYKTLNRDYGSPLSRKSDKPGQ